MLWGIEVIQKGEDEISAELMVNFIFHTSSISSARPNCRSSEVNRSMQPSVRNNFGAIFMKVREQVPCHSGLASPQVYKELDYATNFAANGTGQWKDSGLGEAHVNLKHKSDPQAAARTGLLPAGTMRDRFVSSCCSFSRSGYGFVARARSSLAPVPTSFRYLVRHCLQP